MRFTSASDSSQIAAEHLVVFCYEKRRVLLPLPRSYDDMIQLVKSEFSIEDNGELIIETRELQGCGGEAVELHRRTWDVISPILAQIYVRPRYAATSTAAALITESTHVEAGPSSPPAQSQPATPTRDDPPAAISKVRKRPSVVPPHQAYVLAPPSPVIKTSPRSPGVLGSSTDTRRTSSLNGSANGAETSAATSQAANRQAGSARLSVLRRSLATYNEEEEEEEEQPRSPKKQRSNRKRVTSDEEDEYQIDTALTRSNEAVSTSAQGRAPATPHNGLVASASRLNSTPPIASSVKRPSETPIAPAEQCLITVEYDDGEEICSSTFKTKGRHTVQKVLMTVCKTFAIDSMYSRAELYRIIADDPDDSDGEGSEQRFLCKPTQTMSQVGAYNEARFAIQIQEDETGESST